MYSVSINEMQDRIFMGETYICGAFNGQSETINIQVPRCKCGVLVQEVQVIIACISKPEKYYTEVYTSIRAMQTCVSLGLTTVDEVIHSGCTRYRWTLNDPNWDQSGVECGVFWNTT